MTGGNTENAKAESIKKGWYDRYYILLGLIVLIATIAAVSYLVYFYYQNNDYRADLDENGKVELKDLILLLNYSQKYACKPSSPSLIMPSPCSGVSDGVCPSGCAAGSDNDCCVKAGMTWVNNLCIPRVAYVAKGDFNGNGKVDFNDYVDFAKRFNTTFGGGANSIGFTYNNTFDFDNDRDIDNKDLADFTRIYSG